MAKKINLLNSLFWGILALAIFTRAFLLGELPDGMYPDETYAAYNSYGMMTEGIDSWGYRFPVYFVAWGSGMSVLYSYIAIPFLKIFGMTLFAMRLPQVIFSVLAVIASYFFGKEVTNKKIGLLFAFFLAVNPWHIMNARFALDANMAPNMFMIAVMFIVLAIKNKTKYRYHILAVIFTGLTLYCYAMTWMMIPAFLICLLYYKNDLPKLKVLIVLVILLFILALPLLLFLLVNLGFIEEIKTNFISIPKLLEMRESEIHASNIIASLKKIITITIMQEDGATHTYSTLVGAFYTVTAPFIYIGLFLHAIEFIKSMIDKIKGIGHRKQEGKVVKTDENMMCSESFNYSYIMLFWLATSGIVAVLNQSITIIHINMLHIPLIFYSMYGLYKIYKIFQNKIMIYLSIAMLSISFILFFVDYIKSEDPHFVGEEAYEVIAVAKDLRDGNEKIKIVDYATIKYSNLLWMELPKVSTYVEDVEYTGKLAWQEVKIFHEFEYLENWEALNEEGVYVLNHKDMEHFMQHQFTVKVVNDLYAVAYKE